MIPNARSAGFTLTEIAIVLLVVGLLLGSVLSTVSTQLELRNNRETQSRLDEIKEALIGYVQANGRLPCPADGTIATGVASAGDAASLVSNTCPASNGVVPWATLGVSETDVWGRRFTYSVSSEFSDAVSGTTTWGCGATTPVPTPTQATFALCAQGTFTVTTRTAASKSGSSVTGIPVIIISHGRNGYGAYTSDGKQYSVPSQTGYVDEPANANAAATTFYSREQSSQASSCSDTAAGSNFCEFDDLVDFIPANVLVTRMISAGKLP